MYSKLFPYKFMKLRKLLFFLVVCVPILFYVYRTNYMVTMKSNRIKATEFKGSFNLGHFDNTFLNGGSQESTSKINSHKMIKSTRKKYFDQQFDGNGSTHEKNEEQYPTNLKYSNNNKVHLQENVRFKSQVQVQSKRIRGNKTDNVFIPQKRIISTRKAKHQRCPACENSHKERYHGIDLMTLPTFDFDSAYKNPCWKENDTLRCLPYFYIIGVKKAGTSELWHHISTHPDFAFPNFGKEAQWFARGRFNKKYYWRRRTPRKQFHYDSIDAYVYMFRSASSIIKQAAGQYKNQTPVITADASPSNLHLNSHWRYLPGNENLDEPKYVILDYIHHFIPKAKIIIIFRDPVDRLYSEYYHLYSRQRRRFKSSPEHFHNIVTTGVNLYKDCVKHHTLRSCVYNESIYQETGKSEIKSKTRKVLEDGVWTVIVINIQLGIYHVYWQELTRLFQRKQILVLQNKELSNMERAMTKVFTFLDMRLLPNIILHRETRHANSRKHEDVAKGDMLNQTRKLLEGFYRPFNEEMCHLTGDMTFLYKRNI